MRNERQETRLGDAMMPSPTRAVLFFIPHSAFRIPHWKILLAALVFLTLATAVRADSPPKIVKVRAGLPTGAGDAGRIRQGAWTPVYIHLWAGKDGNSQKQFKLVLDAADLEENPYRYTVPVPALPPQQQGTEAEHIVIGYLRSPH